MKRIIVSIISSIIIISLFFIVFSNPKVNSEAQRLENYISDKNISEIKLVDNLGTLVDNEKIKTKLFEREYIHVNNLLKESKLCFVYSEEIVKNEILDISLNIEREFITSYYKYDIENRRVQEWTTFMNVSYMKNFDGTLIAQDNPIISVDTNLDGVWSTQINNVRTGYTNKNGGKSIEFYGNYRLNIKFGIPLGSNFDYGTMHVINTVEY